MFDELDQLKKLARAIELEAAGTPEDNEEEEDLPAVVIDGEMDNRPYDPDPKVNTYVIGSSNIKSAKKPIFDDEEVSEDSEDDSDSGEEVSDDSESVSDSGEGANIEAPIVGSVQGVEGEDKAVMDCMFKGLGVNLHGSLSNGLHECMDMCDPNCPVAFKVGSFVQPKCCQTPIILVVKNADGGSILTAKPTNNSDEYCEGNCGCWPEFAFNQDEIEPMENVKLSDIFNVMKFNDAQGRTESFNGGVYDETPMDDAQDGALKAQSAYHCPGCDECKDGEFKASWQRHTPDTLDDMNAVLDEICGPMKTYSAETPVIVKKNLDGSTEASQSAYKVSIGTGAF